MRIGLFLVAVVLVSCSPPAEMDAGVTPPRDAGVRRDAGVDAGQFDAGPPPCIDNDNDGRGENCAFPDCDDNNQMVSVLLVGFRDADSDMATVGTAVPVCTSGTLPPTYRATASATPDCDDMDATRSVLLMGYLDADGDGVTVGGAMPFCSGGTLPTNYRAMASALPDCDDTSDAKYISVTGFVDADGDMATVGSMLTFCTNGNLPPGHRAMASAMPDCNDMSASTYLQLTGFLDNDGDLRTVGSAVMLCTGGTLPTNYRAAASATADCDDASSVKYVNVTGFADRDWDGVTVSTSTTFCGAGILPPGYLMAASLPADCDDTTAGVAPNAPELADDGIDNDCGGGDVTHTQITATSNGFYVDGAACTTSPSGSAASPFCNITEAINAVNGTSNSFGTIFIAAGTYNSIVVPISLDLTILGGYRNVNGTWTRNITNNVVRIRPATTSTALSVNIQVPRLIVDGVTLNSPVGVANAFAVQSDSPVWLSRVTMAPDSTSTTPSIGADLNVSATIVGSRITGFNRKAIDFGGTTSHELRIFESTIGLTGDSAGTTIVDFGATSGGGVLIRSTLTSTSGTDVFGVHTPRAPIDTKVVGNTIDLQGATASATWLRNEGNATILGNRFTGSSNTVGCTGLQTVTGSGAGNRTTASGNLVHVTSASTNCVGIRISAGTAELAHNILRVTGTTNADALIIDGTATATVLLNNVIMSRRAITASTNAQLSAYGNLFDSATVNTMVVGASMVTTPATFDACTWQGCVAAGVTKLASPGFTNLAANDYTVVDAGVALNGGADPSRFGITLIPGYAYAPNGPRPVGVGYDIGMFER